VWAAAAVAVLVVAIAVAVVVLLHSSAFHAYVLRFAEQKLSAALKASVQARDFSLHFSGISPAVDIYGLAVGGAAPHADVTLLQVDHVRIAVRVTSVWYRTWYLQELRVDHPVAQLVVDPNGNSNLPHPPSSNSQSHTSVFDLGVRHAHLAGGEVYYNDYQSRLDADLRDLGFLAVFDPASQRYSGSLSYRDGHFKFGQYAPLPHELQAEFEATPAGLTLKRARLASGRSRIELAATVQSYNHPSVQGHYQATLDAGDLRRTLNQPALPSGILALNGKIGYRSEASRPLLDTLTLDGNLSSRTLMVEQPTFRSEVRDLAAHYSLARGDVEIPALRAYLLGGEVDASLSMRAVTGASHARAKAQLRGISLAELKLLANTGSLRQVGLAGMVDGTIDAAWGKTLDDLVATADANIRGGVAPPIHAVGGTATNTAGANPLPVEGTIHARYTAAGKQLSFRQSSLGMPQTTLNLNGVVSEHSSLQVALLANDLHELETIAGMFGVPASSAAPAAASGAAAPVYPLGLYGMAQFTGNITGSTAAPQVQGHLTAQNLRVRGSAWRSLRSDVTLSPSQASLQNGQLISAARGQATFSLTAGLKNWSFTNTSPIQVALNAQQLNLGDLAKAADLQTPLSGSLSTDVTVRGNELNPVGHGTAAVTQASFRGQPIQAINVSFQGDGSQLQATFSGSTPAGSLHGTLTYFPKQQAYEGQLQVPALQLGQLQAVQARNLGISGVLTLNASGRGTFNDPGLEATVQVPELKFHDQSLSGLKIQARVADHVANVALDSQAVNTYVHGIGTVNLGGDYETVATLDTRTIPLQPLIALYEPAQAGNITGQTELHVTLRGPLKDKSRLEAHLTVPSLALNYLDKVQIGAPSPIHMDFVNGVLTLQRSALRGTGTNLEFQGSIPIAGGAPLAVALQGTVDLRLAQLFDPDLSSSGQLQFDINSYGQRTDPNVEGQVKIVNANFASGNAPIGLQNGNGVLTLTKDRLNVTQWTANVGGGQVTASGGIAYRPSVRFDLALKANGVRMLYPPGVRQAADANLALTGSTDSALLSGLVKIDQLSLTPDFDLMNFIGQMSGGTTPAPSQGFTQNLNLNLGLQSTSDVHLVGKTMSLDGSANLRVTGTADNPVILGRVDLSGGDLIFRGNRYVLQSGTLLFVNPTETQPVVNVAVDTTIQQYNIHLRFEGPADQLRTNYSSDPALAPADIINLLAFGKTTEAAAANPTSTNFEAESAIASGVSSEVTSRLQKIAGISQLSVDPLLGCNQQTPGACVTIQQRVTGNLFITFATDVNSFQNDTIQGEYRLSPRVSLSGTRDQNGGFGFDTRITKTW
jgi:translocation and assembly module TamB